MNYLSDCTCWKTVAIAGFAVALTVYLTARMKSDGKSVDKTSKKRIIGDTTVLRFLEYELNELNRVPSSNFVTFFKGKVCIDTFKSKLNDVIKANPWLMGRIIQSKDFGEVALSYATEFDAIQEHDLFVFVKNNALNRNMKDFELSDHCKQYFITPAAYCIDKNEPVVRVVLFEIKKDEEYALLMSMSHVVGDGHTLYTVYSMLDLDTPARSLIVERNHDFKVLDRKVLGDKLMDWFRRPALIISILTTVLFRKKVNASAYKVSEKAIKKIKSEYVHKNASLPDPKDGKAEYGRVPFISTNDILTSWFSTVCKSTVCLMPINFRDRLPGITSEHAGNYERCLLYGSADYSEPNLIRQSIIPDRDGMYKVRTSEFPSSLETIFGNMSVVTNWATFYKDIRITEKPSAAEQDIFHRPVNRPEDAVFTDICFIFKTNQNTTAVYYYCRSADLGPLVAVKHESVKVLAEGLF